MTKRTEMETSPLDGDGLKRLLTARATELGFARVGVARAEAMRDEGERLRAWIDSGRHGSMTWMADTATVRANPLDEGMLPTAKTVVVLAMPYAAKSASPAIEGARIARYARGRDYHDLVGRRAQRVARVLRMRGFATRAGADLLPVFERAWAARSGVGFIGKNACLIVPGVGSHVVLASLVTEAELPPDEPMRERCGACSRCLDACPTSAIIDAREVDARRCISYLTIESEAAPPPELRPKMGDWLFGCDACQDVCPFNERGATEASIPEPLRRDGPWSTLSLADVLTLDEDSFRLATGNSALRRAGRAGLVRNALVTIANGKKRVFLPIVRELANDDPSEVVRETAAWTAEHLTRGA